eukprot:scaffold46006_cov48-Prasinocladus_malaysianus.AAC.1
MGMQLRPLMTRPAQPAMASGDNCTSSCHSGSTRCPRKPTSKESCRQKTQAVKSRATSCQAPWRSALG